MVVVLCLIVTAALGWYKYQDIQAAMALGASFGERREAVEVIEALAVQRTPMLTVTGEVVATRSAQLRNELAGRIVRVGFAPGSRVSAGQILLQLDVAQERAQLAESRAQQRIAQLALERAQRLVTTGAGSVERRDQAQAEFDASGARVRALEALIAKNTLTAPFDAIASLHQLEVGQFLDAGTVITDLVGISDQVWIDFALPQDKAAISVGGTVRIWAEQQASLNAEVVARDASVNVQSRNLTLRAQLPRQAVDWLPGMLVQVEVAVGEQRSATAVPSTAVRQDVLGASVYVINEVDEQGELRTRAFKRQVQLAPPQEGGDSAMTIIVSGLQPGERVASVGAFKLDDGVLVSIREPQPDLAERLVGH